MDFFGSGLLFQVENIPHELLHVVAHRGAVFRASFAHELGYRGWVVALHVGRLRRGVMAITLCYVKQSAP